MTNEGWWPSRLGSAKSGIDVAEHISHVKWRRAVIGPASRSEQRVARRFVLRGTGLHEPLPWESFRCRLAGLGRDGGISWEPTPAASGRLGVSRRFNTCDSALGTRGQGV